MQENKHAQETILCLLIEHPATNLFVATSDNHSVLAIMRNRIKYYGINPKIEDLFLDIDLFLQEYTLQLKYKKEPQSWMSSFSSTGRIRATNFDFEQDEVELDAHVDFFVINKL